MKRLAIGIVAAGTLIGAAMIPAAAQVRFEGPGVGLHIGPTHPYYHDYGWDRGRHYGWRRDRDRDCRTVTVRERRSDGTVVVRTRERC
jgi:hypothetical protein